MSNVNKGVKVLGKAGKGKIWPTKGQPPN